jgi:hypothetical protein
VALRKIEKHTCSRKRLGGCDGGRDSNPCNERAVLVLLDFLDTLEKVIEFKLMRH